MITLKNFFNIRKAIFVKRLDEKSLEEIEEAFLMSDLGVNNTNLLIDELKNKKLIPIIIHKKM